MEELISFWEGLSAADKKAVADILDTTVPRMYSVVSRVRNGDARAVTVPMANAFANLSDLYPAAPCRHQIRPDFFSPTECPLVCGLTAANTPATSVA